MVSCCIWFKFEFKDQVAPIIISDYDLVTVIQGSPIKFEAFIDSKSKVKVEWFSNGKKLSAKDGVKIDNNLDIYSIIIRSTQSVDSFITCKAINDFGESEKIFRFEIISFWNFFLFFYLIFSLTFFFYLAPPKIVDKLENIIANENESIVLSFKFNGFPKPSVKLFKDEEELDFTLENFDIVETEDFYSFKFNKLSKINAGTYYLELNNQAGSFKSNKFQIIVNR